MARNGTVLVARIGTVYYTAYRSQIIVDNGFAYINEYKLDTCDIIDKLLTLSNIYDPD